MARPRPTRNPALLLLAGTILLPIVLGCGGQHELVHRGEPAAPVAEPLPDSVLAVVGAHREVSVALFKRSWKQVVPPARPDSLTPEGVRKFLDLLIDKEAIGEAAERETWTWSDRERTDFEGLRDRLTVGAVLDSSLRDLRRRLGSQGDSLSRQALGTMARDSTVARAHPVFDDSLTRRLARAWAALPRPNSDSSLFAQLRVLRTMPTVPPSDTGRVLARSDAGDYRVRDLLSAWKKLDPTYRPRVDDPAQIRDLVRNGLFERMLRNEAARRALDQRPDIVATLAGQREFIDVSHLVQRDVFNRVPTDSTALLDHYRAHPSTWDLPLRVRVVRIVVPQARDAAEMARRLRNAAEAESLTANALRGGVNYVAEVTAAGDSVLFRRALQAGPEAVLGPSQVKDGWEVVRVVAVLPGRPRQFREVRELVAHDWNAKEGERLMRALCDRARATAGVRVNERALAKLAER